MFSPHLRVWNHLSNRAGMRETQQMAIFQQPAKEQKIIRDNLSQKVSHVSGSERPLCSRIISFGNRFVKNREAKDS
jgi:hypothetical protein